MSAEVQANFSSPARIFFHPEDVVTPGSVDADRRFAAMLSAPNARVRERYWCVCAAVCLAPWATAEARCVRSTHPHTEELES
jgi:hypothetical protein